MTEMVPDEAGEEHCVCLRSSLISPCHSECCQCKDVILRVLGFRSTFVFPCRYTPAPASAPSSAGLCCTFTADTISRPSQKGISTGSVGEARLSAPAARSLASSYTLTPRHMYCECTPTPKAKTAGVQFLEDSLHAAHLDCLS